MRLVLVLATAVMAFSGPASADLVMPPALQDEDLIQTALSLCVVPAANTTTKFIAAAKRIGFSISGNSPALRLISFEDDGRMGALHITGLKGSPSLFDCRVSSSGTHGAALKRSLVTTLKANYPDLQDFPVTHGWIFHKDGQEFVASIEQSESLGTTAIQISFTGINK